MDYINKLLVPDFLVPTPHSRTRLLTEEPTANKMFWAEEFLMNIQQAERPLEQYVEEYLNVLHLVSWSDSMINACFQMGRKDDQLFCSVTPDDCRRPVAEFINHILALCHSDFYVDVEDSNLPPHPKTCRCPSSPPASFLYLLLQRAHSFRSPELLPYPQPRTCGLLSDSGHGPLMDSSRGPVL
ncbi:hypothetical protein M9458_020042, partial [Cirrhinus mrigala]